MRRHCVNDFDFRNLSKRNVVRATAVVELNSDWLNRFTRTGVSTIGTGDGNDKTNARNCTASADGNDHATNGFDVVQKPLDTMSLQSFRLLYSIMSAQFDLFERHGNGQFKWRARNRNGDDT